MGTHYHWQWNFYLMLLNLTFFLFYSTISSDDRKLLIIILHFPHLRFYSVQLSYSVLPKENLSHGITALSKSTMEMKLANSQSVSQAGTYLSSMNLFYAINAKNT
jgi:hypothetical protein